MRSSVEARAASSSGSVTEREESCACVRRGASLGTGGCDVAHSAKGR
jgi:hypothetical protein